MTNKFCVKCGVLVEADGSECSRCGFDTLVVTHHYLNVISTGPLIIARVPWPMPAWRSGILRALTAVMNSHGFMQKDITSIEGLVPRPDETDRDAKDQQLADRVDLAIGGDGSILPEFWFYDWQDGAFKLARGALGGP